MSSGCGADCGMSSAAEQRDDRMWELARASGISRRRYLKLLAVGGAAAVLAACSGQKLPRSDDGASAVGAPTTAATDAAAAGPGYFKDPAPFIERGTAGLEARLENMQGATTPNRLFFVRNNSRSLALDADSWRLSVEGDAVAEPVELSYADIRAMPSTTLTAYLECAGNHRAMFGLVNGREASGTQWERGAVSNGEWIGVSLGSVLERAGMDASAARSVLLVGLDAESPEGGFRRAMPVDKAMDPHTLLAWGLNGELLPPDQGFPLRAVVPGWVGSSWIKWVGRIVVSAEPVWTRNNTTSYVLIGDDYPPEGRADGAPLTAQSIKSALALPWPARLPVGPQLVHGFAQSPDPIAKVEWSTDSGATWSEAELQSPPARYSWTRFEFAWSPSPGDYTVMTRATDVTGSTQPDEVPFNEKGYLFNQPLPHPVTVT